MASSSDFEKHMRELYAKYLRHCADTGILLPAPYPRFKEKVAEQAARMMAHDMADQVPEEDWDKALYVAMRVSDMKAPAGSNIKRKCGQCGQDVWVDPTMLDKLSKSVAVICNQCLPEVTGKTVEQAIDKELGSS